ncbi:PREDICTED: xin actin-binding repeat-containing protein 2 [Chinchilla lanigera]|uniref:Xin actin binding repeat containing 2 n=1 Tax=Chinchilla lanigera TaxID=34839 RepID=A0A8C2UPL9_CHILA|nr:PREDICTED: xin actin-binding repeat-containing protein 2 [Chinchilla lanigera]
MARYQAAVSRGDCHSFSANMMEESKMCTVPGGLAKVKKQFEKDEIISSCDTFSQFHQNRSEQEVIQSSQGMRRNEEVSKANGINVLETEMVSHLEKHTEEISQNSQFSQYVQETVIDTPDDEEIPKVSTKTLKEQFEKSAQEKVLYSDKETTNPAKQIKIKNEYEEIIKPTSVVGTSSSSYASTSQRKETSSSRYSGLNATCSTLAQVKATAPGETEKFPPPPPDLLQTPVDVTAFSQSPELPNPPRKLPVPKEVYSKQRNLYELNRLYKHIHPDLRKNLEKDYISEVSEIVSSQKSTGSSVSADVQHARYVFENTNDSSQKDLNSEREYLEWDEILKGEVQSMRWIFENQPLDSINSGSPDESSNAKGIADQEIIAGGDVKYTTWMFETQPIDTLGFCSSENRVNVDKIPELARGDVSTARLMFETRPLDSMNKMHQNEEESAFTTRDITGGDVKTVRYMFETQHLDQLGQLHSVDEVNLLQLRSELKEIKGNVKRSIKCFETQPLYVIRDGLGQVLEIKTVHREDIEKGDVRRARWLFETQPLDTINKDITEVKVVRGISMEENVKGGVSRAKWLFETQPLEKIKEELEEVVVQKEAIIGTDVSKKCWMFETQPLDILKETSEANPVLAEEIIGGDVQTTKHLFETLPIEALKDSPDVGKLQKITTSEEEKGDVRHHKWVFETQPLEEIREDKKEYTRTVKLEEVDRGDVRNYTHIFESNNLIKFDASHKIEVEGVTRGAVELNKSLFEAMPLYAIQDHLGKYHQVKTVQQEEILRGDVRSCRWLFETRPIDQFDESLLKFQIIRGISAQEIQSGNVKSAKWLFETQPLDSIKYFSNVEEIENKAEQVTDTVKGDVKTCKWLFETQPMESLYEKVSLMTESEEIRKGDVKTCTWLFETQPLDTIKDDSETTFTLQTVKQDEIQGGDVRTACLLFETENLDSIQGKEGKESKTVEMDIQAGDVSSMRYKFESQSLDSISSSSEEVLKKIKTLKAEDIQKGDVLHCRWLFENHPIDTIKESQESDGLVKTVTDIRGGDVRKRCFIFETFSLDEIKEECDCITTKKTNTEEVVKGDVKSYRMLFETQPLYAIQDQEGYFHEVTTVKKEEVLHGDVRGTRWLFETKPLDSINESQTVYVIKSVTQEDIQKGDVSSVRYRFETQPLDQISEESHKIVPTVNHIQGGNVKTSKQLFEAENLGKNYVRTVCVNEIQKGNVKTSTWLFETHTLEELRGEGSEYRCIKTVTQEDVQKGDVKQAVWLFENQTLDSIKDAEESITKMTKEEIPASDVRTTTWLFETTPIHEFNENRVEKVEVIGKSIKETLKELYSQKVIEAPGIIIETDEVGDVRMAKYKLMHQASPEIQKEEVIRADLGNIMMNLLSKKDCTKKEIVISEEEKGNVNLTKAQLLNRATEVQAEKEEIVKGDVQQAIKKLFSEERPAKKGILIQEDERGDINMTIYCLLHENTGDTIKHEEVIGGDVRHTIHNLLSSSSNSAVSERAKIDASERGNVQFFTTCIETGALDYLKQLQTEPHETLATGKQEREEEIIGVDVERTKWLLKKRQSQVERTVNETNIIPGDVRNTVKVFMTEPPSTSYKTNKEDIIKGDLKSTLTSLSQAISQKTVTKAEETKGDMLATLKSLKESKQRWEESKQPDATPGDVEKAIECLEKATNTRTEILKKELIRDDLEISLRALKEVQRGFIEVDKESIIKKDVHAEAAGSSEERKTKIHQVAIQRDQESVLRPRPGPLGQDTVSEAEGTSCYGTSTGERMDLNLPKAPKGTVKIVVDREQNNDALEKNLRKLSNSYREGMRNVLETGDRMGVWKDTTKEQQFRGEHMNRQLTSMVSTKENLTTKESEAVRQLKKEDILKSTQSIDKTLGKHQFQTCEPRNDYQKTETFHIKSSQKTKNIKTSTEMQSPTPSPSQHPVNMQVGEAYEVTKGIQKQTMLKQERQYPNKGVEKDDMNFHPFPIDQNISSVTEEKVSERSHNKFKAIDKKQKTDVYLESQDFLMKTNTSKDLKMAMESSFNLINLNPENNGRESEGSLPPPSPPPPPASNASSEIEFPLPPPPPLNLLPEKHEFPPPPSTEKIRAEFKSFPGLPLPPPPVDEKSEGERPPELLPPPPPPTPSQNSAHLSFSVPEKHSEAFIQQYSQKEAASSQKTYSHAKVIKGKSPPPTLPKPKLPKLIKDKKNQLSPEGELGSSLSNMQYTNPALKHHERTMVTTNREHADTKQDVLRNHLDERTQLSVDSTKPFSQRIPETSALKGEQKVPLMKSHSLPESSSQQSQKPYMRKFKTPLMIAEEKYRQQKEELEKQRKESFCCNVVKMECTNQKLSELEKEVLLEKTNAETPAPRTDSEFTVGQPNPDAPSNARVSGVCSDYELSTASAVTATTNRHQHVVAASEDKSNMKKEVLQSSRNIKQSKSALEINQSHQEYSTHHTQQKYMEQLNLHQSKPASPSFKVKTIKLPTLDQTLNKTDHTYESHVKQAAVDVQTIAKQQYQETEKAEANAEHNTKQSVAEHCYQLPKKEKTVSVQMPMGSAEKSSENKFKIVPEKQRECRESDREKLLGSEGKSQGASIISSKEDRLIVEGKQAYLKNKSAPKVVKPKVIDVHLDSQTQNFQQTHIQTSKSASQHKKLSQPYNSLQQKKCLRDKGTQQKQGFSNPEDSRQAISQNKSSFSSVKESQQDDGKCAVNILEFLRKREELQQILSRVKQFEAEPNKNGLKTFQTLLNIIPRWLISEEKREYGVRIATENNLEKVKEEIKHIKTQAEDMLGYCENIIQTAMVASQTGRQGNKLITLNETSLKVSSTNASCSKNMEQKENNVVKQKIVHHQEATQKGATAPNYVKTHQEINVDGSKSTPSLKNRPPSPTFITIESSARRTETSSKDELSQLPIEDSCVETPPRRPLPHTSGIHKENTSPSPPRSRSEQLVKLKDTTAKLSRGTIPRTPVTPVPIVEKRSEIVLSPASLRRQIKIESRGRDSSPTITIPVDINHISNSSYRESMQALEEVRKVEKRATYVHKDGMNSINGIMPDIESYDAVEIIRKVEVPRLSERPQRYEAANRTAQMAENFMSDHKNDINKWFREFEDGPVFEAKSQRVYENGDVNHNVKQESHMFCKEEFGSTSLENTNFTGFFHKNPRELQEQNSAQHPRVHSETRSLTEHFSSMDAFENQAVGSKVTTSSAHSSEVGKSGLDFKHAPPTYEDVISGHILDISDSPKELRKNFQKTWEGSERVFKSLGYTTSDAAATEMRSTFEEESAFISETATPRQGNMYTLSKDSLSNGMPSSRQAEFS